MRLLRHLGICVLLLWPSAASAQAAARLSTSAIDSIVAFYNRDGTMRLLGDTRIEAGQRSGDLAVLEGRLVLAGLVQGSVLVLNGDLEILPAARVEGRAIVMGGSVTGATQNVAGGVTTYSSFGYQLSNGRLSYLPRRRPAELAAGRTFDFGRTDIIVTARPGYNRVEGLPILFGPRFTLGHSNPTIVESLITYRTAAGLEVGTEDLGYALRLEQFLGGTKSLRAGIRAYSEIATIEDAGISDRESSLAAFVLHRDYRDHFEREGGAAYLRFEPPGSALDLRLEYATERHNTVRARRPFSLTDNSKPWRVQPLAAQGNLRRLTASLIFDTRNEPLDPSHGWWITSDVERGLSGTLRERFDGRDTLAANSFWHGTLDLRRFARLGPASRLGVRILATGSIDGGALPVQRQHALGGEGSLPGFDFHQFDCGGSNQVVRSGDARFQRYYGCDRAALMQLEYQTDFTFLNALRGSKIDQLGLFQRVRLVGFVDAGRAWTRPQARGVREPGSSEFSADAGLGLRLGRLGVYWAAPLSGSGQPMNFFLRVGQRF